MPEYPVCMKYKRILLKLSGEALMGNSKKGSFDPEILEQYAAEIKAVKDQGVQIAIVIGGGNIFRGGQADALGIERVQGDYMRSEEHTSEPVTLESRMPSSA